MLQKGPVKDFVHKHRRTFGFNVYIHVDPFMQILAKWLGHAMVSVLIGFWVMRTGTGGAKVEIGDVCRYWQLGPLKPGLQKHIPKWPLIT